MTIHQAEAGLVAPPDRGACPDTLPGHYYFDPGVWEEEKRKIFYRTWQYVGHVSMLSQPSTYLVRDIADESIIVLRNGTGELRAFYNVCRHRAHRLLEGEGNLKPLITCPYHAWSYDHEGALRAARGTADIAAFDSSRWCLTPVRLDTLCGFLFVNLDPQATSLAEQTAGLEEEMRAFSPRPEDLVLAERYGIDLKANWKNSVENFSECYHCPNRHPTLAQNALDLKTYKIECYPGHHVHRSRDTGDDVAYSIDAEEAARPNEFRSFLVWPNTVFEVYPGGNFTVFHHVPMSPEETVQGIEWYFASAELGRREREVVDFVHVVRMEDVPICESVQKGLHSRGYDHGCFVIDPGRTDLSEHAVHDFQRKVVAALEA